MWKHRLLALAVTVSLSGCLIDDDRSHTLYLDPDGAVTWSILEAGIRSDAGSAEERAVEEREFLATVAGDRHRSAEALGELYPAWIESRVVRDERPYTLVTSARFPAIERVYDELLARTGIPAIVTLETRADSKRLLVVAKPDESDDLLGDDAPWHELLALFDDCAIHLTAGKFLDATGFTISTDGTVARPIPLEDGDLEHEVVLSLSWSAEG